MGFLKRNRLSVLVALCTVFLAGLPVLASEADLPIPDFKDGTITFCWPASWYVCSECSSVSMNS